MDMKKQKSTVKRILGAIGRYKWGVLASLACAFITVLLSLYIPILTGRAIDCILGPGEVDFTGMWKILVKIGVIIGITAASQWLMSHINNQITYQVVKDIRTQAFNKLEILPLKYIDSHAHRGFNHCGNVAFYVLYQSGYSHCGGSCDTCVLICSQLCSEKNLSHVSEAVSGKRRDDLPCGRNAGKPEGSPGI